MKAVQNQNSQSSTPRGQGMTPEAIQAIRDFVTYFTKSRGYRVAGMEDEDLVQECVLWFLERGYLDAPLRTRKCSFRTFISFGVRNHLVDLMRKYNRGELSLDVPILSLSDKGSDVVCLIDIVASDSASKPEDFVLALDFFNRVKFALPCEAEGEKVSLRQIFVEYFERMLTCAEIAKKYCMSLGSVYERLHFIQEVASFL